MDYEKQARDFLEKTGVTMHKTYLGCMKHFDDDKEKRDVYSISLTRGDKAYTFRYGDSINNTDENRNRATRRGPTAYDVLSCLTKYPVEEDIDEFAANYGYEKPSIALRMFKAVNEEWEGVSSIWSSEEELEELREIQ